MLSQQVVGIVEIIEEIYLSEEVCIFSGINLLKCLNELQV